MRGRVLTVVSDLGLGGTQRVAEAYAGLYRELGLESAVLARMDGGPREVSLRAAGIEVFSPQRGLDHARAASAFRPDLVHIHRHGGSEASTADLLDLLDRSGDAVVIETNVFGRPDYSLPPGRISLHGHVSLWSQWRWERWGRWLPGSPTGLLLPNTLAVTSARVDQERAADVRRELEIPGSAFLVGRVGQPSEAKWSCETVEAFARFAEECADAWLVLVGPPPSVRRSVQALGREVGNRVRILEPVADDGWLSAAYATMDVFLHTSRIGESFGMVLAESMLQGTPVVTLSTPTQDNGQVEVVGDHIGGRVAVDCAGLIAGLRHFRDNDAVRRQAGLSGAARTGRLFGRDRVRRRLSAVLDVLDAWDRRSPLPTPDDDLEREVLLGLTDEEAPTIDGLVASVSQTLRPVVRMKVAVKHHPATYLASHPRDLRSWICRSSAI